MQCRVLSLRAMTFYFRSEMKYCPLVGLYRCQLTRSGHLLCLAQAAIDGQVTWPADEAAILFWGLRCRFYDRGRHNSHRRRRSQHLAGLDLVRRLQDRM